MGRDFGENSMMIDEQHEDIRVSGFAGLPTFNRGNSLHQFLFVNGRPVRDKLLVGALRGAYSDVMSHDRYPVAALFIDLPSAQVDVNVHPAKAEVRFRDPSLVRRLIVTSIRNALMEYGHKSSTVATASAIEKLHASKPVYYGSKGNGISAPVQGNLAEAVHRYYAPTGSIEPSARVETDNIPEAIETPDYPLGAPRTQIHENYIIAQTESGMVIVDQHAAHERLTYEKLKSNYLSGKVPAQLLLTPEIIETGREAANLLLDHSEVFSNLGLELEAFGTGTIAVRSVPEILGTRIDINKMIEDLIDHLEENENPSSLEEKINDILSRMACHGSVRSGRRLNIDEMHYLLREMEKNPMTGQCNHGRPIYIELKLSDIEKLFGSK